MTLHALTESRARLRAARGVPEQPLPYEWRWEPPDPDGMHQLIVTVKADGQEIPISYNTVNRPDEARAAAIAARLYEYRRDR